MALRLGGFFVAVLACQMQRASLIDAMQVAEEPSTLLLNVSSVAPPRGRFAAVPSRVLTCGAITLQTGFVQQSHPVCPRWMLDLWGFVRVYNPDCTVRLVVCGGGDQPAISVIVHYGTNAAADMKSSSSSSSSSSIGPFRVLRDDNRVHVTKLPMMLGVVWVEVRDKSRSMAIYFDRDTFPFGRPTEDVASSLAAWKTIDSGAAAATARGQGVTEEEAKGAVDGGDVGDSESERPPEGDRRTQRVRVHVDGVERERERDERMQQHPAAPPALPSPPSPSPPRLVFSASVGSHDANIASICDGKVLGVVEFERVFGTRYFDLHLLATKQVGGNKWLASRGRRDPADDDLEHARLKGEVVRPYLVTALQHLNKLTRGGRARGGCAGSSSEGDAVVYDAGIIVDQHTPLYMVAALKKVVPLRSVAGRWTMVNHHYSHALRSW